MEEEHKIEEELKLICQQIFAEEQVQQRKKQEMNASILNHLSNIPKDQTISEAVRIFKVPLQFLDKELEKLKFEFKSKTDSFHNIEKFNNIYKSYEQSIKQISLSSYCLKDFLDTDPKMPPMIECCKLKFVKYFQTVFQQYLFDSVVDLLTRARIQLNEIDRITSILKQFGINLHQLQLTTAQEIEQYLPESSFKQYLYDHFEETYQNYFQQWYNQFDTEQYLNKVSLELEINSKIITFEDESILKQINLILYSHLLTQYKSVLLSDKNPKNFKNLIREYQTNSNAIQPILTVIGDLYANLNDHYDKITQNFKEIIKTEGLQIMTEKNLQIEQKHQQIERKQSDWNEKTFISKLFELYDQYLQMINKCFNIKSDFQMALNNAFESFINIPIGQNLEISDYLVICMSNLLEDQKVKKRQQSFENLVQLFVFLNHKERFIKLYKRQLAKRLLNYARFIGDFKKIQKLCQQEMDAVKEMEKKCGAQDLESLRYMIKDLQSPEVEIKIDKNANILIHSPTIINKQQWPQFEEFKVNLLLENERFKQSVVEGNTQKQLIWLDCISSVEIYCAEEQNSYNITVPQAQILFLYNFQNEFLNLKQIQEQTQLPEGIVQKNCAILVLILLIQVDFKILRTEIQNAEKCFMFNSEKSEMPKKRLKKTNLKLVDADFSVIAQVEQVKLENDRDGALEASIVKIMKKEKVLQFTDLIVKVQMEQAQFSPTYNQIKIQIEKLTKNEYLERDKENMQIVRYI